MNTRQFGAILGFELKSYLKNKIFVGVTVFIVVVLTVVMFFPRVAQAFESTPEPDIEGSVGGSGEGSGEETDFREKFDKMLVKYTGQDDKELIRQIFLGNFMTYNVIMTDESVDEIRDKVRSGEVECAFVLDSFTSYTYYVDNLSMYDYNSEIARSALQTLYQMNAMINGGLSEEQAQLILAGITIDGNTESLGKDQMQNFFYTYIMIFALYMVILLYGQMVATNVASEKSSRAMELLITSADPVSMMFGKVIASCLAGLMQLTAVFGSSILLFNINREYWDAGGIMASVFDMPLDLLLFMLLFFVLGFLIYAFLFGAIGSTASKLEDINTSVLPVMFLFIFGFLVVVIGMSSGEVDSILMRVCSYIPFTSPMAMFTRIAMSTVPTYEIMISVSLLFASVIGTGVIAAKIYRVGVLLYGTPPKLLAIIKAIRKA